MNDDRPLEVTDIHFNQRAIIRRIAKENGVGLRVAKIMYNGGKQDISLASASTIEYMNNQTLTSVQKLKKVYAKMNKEDVTPENFIFHFFKAFPEIQEIGAERYLINTFFRRMEKSRISIKGSIKILRMKAYVYSKTHRVSYKTALSMLSFGLSKENAQEFNEVIDYETQTGSVKNDNINVRYKNYLLNSDKFKKKNVYGIALVSRTGDGLSKLEAIVTEAFKNATPEYLEALMKCVPKGNLVCTDYYLSDMSGKCIDYAGLISVVYSKNGLAFDKSNFLHETGHFLDFHANQVSINDPRFRELLDSIKNKVGMKIYSDARGFLNLENGIDQRYSRNTALNEKWLAEINAKHPGISHEERMALLEEKIAEEQEKYQVLIGAIYDIYDMTTKGKLKSLYGSRVRGHGWHYLKEKDVDLIEFFADINEIINMGGEEILRFELGPELADAIIATYKDVMAKTFAQADENIDTNTETQGGATR